MRTQKGLIVTLVVLVAGLGFLISKMQPGPDPHSHSHGEAEAEKPKVDPKRQADLDKLCDPKTKNWTLDPKLKTVTTKTGLKYQDIKVGTGPMPKLGDTALVDYVGWLWNGHRFDTSLMPGREPFPFIVGKGKVIKGWDEGVSTMHVGGIRRLYIPAKLGYGEIGAVPDIPPNATLVFMVRLLAIDQKSGAKSDGDSHDGHDHK